mgnify:CR=1 FL=1
MHKFMDDRSDFIIIAQFIEVLGKNFYDVVRRKIESFLPDIRKAPNTGIRPAGGFVTAHTGNLRGLHVFKRRTS